MMTRATMDAGLLSDGVAIVVDRVMNSDLDFRITIVPTVRGYAKKIHVHSWIGLEPAESSMGRLRLSAASQINKSPSQQREQIRRDVITEALWRSLGLRWRTEPGPELPYNLDLDLCIEIPAEERNRLPAVESGIVPNISPDRILVLSAPFGHAELLAAFMGDGLGFGTVDLRYQGFRDLQSEVEVVRFCLDTITERSSRYVWSISEAASITSQIEEALVRAASSHLVKTRQVDMSLLTDHVRYSAAEVMNLIYDKGNGPPASRWGDKFDDLIYGAGTKARIPGRSSQVRWCEPNTFTSWR
jgi:hypothetical protein